MANLDFSGDRCDNPLQCLKESISAVERYAVLLTNVILVIFGTVDQCCFSLLTFFFNNGTEPVQDSSAGVADEGGSTPNLVASSA